MPGVISTGAHPKLLWPGVKAIWGQVYAAHSPEYMDLFEIDNSRQAYEQDVEITGFGLAPVKNEGGPISYDSEQQGWVSTYKHIAYALGFIVTHEEKMDNLYKQVATRRAKANAFSVNQTIENVAAHIYNDAFAGNYFTMPDGKPLIATDHVSANGNTFSNRLPTDADLAEATLEDLAVQIMQAEQGRGLKIAVMMQSLHVPPQEWFNANRILKSVLQADTANNNINVLRQTNALPGGIKMNHYFTSPHAWFVRTNVPEGMKFYWREKPDFQQDNEFDTKNAKAATYFRMSVGCTDPRSIYGSNGP